MVCHYPDAGHRNHMGVTHSYTCTLTATKECKQNGTIADPGEYHGCHGNPLCQLQCNILLTAGSWSHATAQRAKIHWQHLARALLRVSYADEIFILCEEKHITDNSGMLLCHCDSDIVCSQRRSRRLVKFLTSLAWH